MAQSNWPYPEDVQNEECRISRSKPHVCFFAPSKQTTLLKGSKTECSNSY